MVLYSFIKLLHLIYSFLLTGSLLFFRVNMFLSSQFITFFSSFELKAIILLSSEKTLCFSLLNLHCVFNISLLLFMIFLLPSLSLSKSIFFFMVYCVCVKRIGLCNFLCCSSCVVLLILVFY